MSEKNKLSDTIRLCTGCCCEYDVSLNPNNSYLCLACFSGLEKREAIEVDKKIQPNNKKRSKTGLPVGIVQRKDREGNLIGYGAKCGSYNLYYSISRYGAKNALHRAKKSRLAMVRLCKDPNKILAYVTQDRKSRKAASCKIMPELPLGIGFCRRSEKERERFAVTVFLNQKKYTVQFSIASLGKELAYKLSIQALKEMRKITNPYKMRYFISTTCNEWKRKYSNKKGVDLPKGLSTSIVNGILRYQVTRRTKTKVFRKLFSSHKVGESVALKKAKEFWSEVRFINNLEELDSYFSYKRKKDLPTGVGCRVDEEGNVKGYDFYIDMWRHNFYFSRSASYFRDKPKEAVLELSENFRSLMKKAENLEEARLIFKEFKASL